MVEYNFLGMERFEKLEGKSNSLLTSILSSNGGEEDTPSPLWGVPCGA
jgi:hypothetical protein